MSEQPGGMILRRYGTTVQSVKPHFDSRALTEVGFRRDHAFSQGAEEFFDAYEKVRSEEITATAEGPVQDEAEEALLDGLEERLGRLREGLGPDEVLLIESDDRDYPKTRDRKKNVIVDGENRLHFRWRVDPPLRVAVYRRR